MSIYIITAPTIGLAKIGFARMPYQRLSNLRIGSPVPLLFAAFIPGTIENEKQLHRRFGQARSHGEWFEITPELQQLIDLYRVEHQSKRRVKHRPYSLPISAFDAERNERWLKAYSAEASLGGPVSRSAIEQRMADAA